MHSNAIQKAAEVAAAPAEVRETELGHTEE